MGNISKLRKKYTTPAHPWQKSRIVEEKKIIKDYGLKNHKELWIMKSFIENAKSQAKTLIPLNTEQSKKEEKQLLDKLTRMGLLNPNSSITDVLNLNVDDVLNRRLQTVVFKKKMAKSMKQARQMIVHGHVLVNNEKITSPSYLVRVDEESTVEFSPKSPFYSEDHPERTIPVKSENIKGSVKEVVKNE